MAKTSAAKASAEPLAGPPDTTGPVIEVNNQQVWVIEPGLLGMRTARMTFVEAEAAVAFGTMRRLSGRLYKRIPEPPPTLVNLVVVPQSATEGEAYAGTITGAVDGSTITLKPGGPLPAGLTLNSAARTITGTPTEDGSFDYTLIETLAGAIGSPKESPNTLTVSAIVEDEPEPELKDTSA